jgi:hypothetical protein
MGVGLEVRNDGQFLQIDGESPLFGLAASGTTKSTTITVGGLSAPIMALSGTGWVVGVTNDGASYTWTLITDGDYIDYYVYDVASGIPSANGMGMEVFDASGRLIYSTAAKPMNISGSVSLPADRTGVLASYGARRLATITNYQPPSRYDTTYSSSAYGVGFYDANTSAAFYAPSTPRKDQSVTGYVSGEVTSYESSYTPEVGRGDPPDPTATFGGQWDFYVIDVTSLV